jgi:hypothetical protein
LTDAGCSAAIYVGEPQFRFPRRFSKSPDARADSLSGLHGVQGHRVWEEGPLEIWVKPLADGSHVVGLFNRSESATKMTLDLNSVGAPASAKLRDLLDHKDLGTVQNSYSAEVPKHGVVLVKVSK